MEDSIEIRLSESDCNRIGNIFDLACKAGGLEAALTVVPLAERFREAWADHKKRKDSPIVAVAAMPR